MLFIEMPGEAAAWAGLFLFDSLAVFLTIYQGVKRRSVEQSIIRVIVRDGEFLTLFSALFVATHTYIEGSIYYLLVFSLHIYSDINGLKRKFRVLAGANLANILSFIVSLYISASFLLNAHTKSFPVVW